MSASLPPRIDSIRLARNGSDISGSLSLTRLSRLQEATLDASGEAAVELRFDRDDQRRHVITGSVEADVVVVCQRCMKAMDTHVHGDVSLGIVTSEAQMAALPGQYEPLMVDEEDLTDLHELVEDELLLALPLAPMHADDEACLGREQIRQVEQKNTSAKEGEPAEAEKPNPFAVLADLKKH